jgi:hypothetical protein
MNRLLLQFVLPALLLGDAQSRECQAGESLVVPYARVPGDATSESFWVRVNGIHVEAAHLALNVGYAHFAFRGSVRVEIAVRDPIRTFDLSPHRAQIKAKADGKVRSFELRQPQKLHLTVNELQRFFLFAHGRGRQRYAERE